MPQFARPEADLNNAGSYSNQLGSGTNLFNVIDEAIQDNTDYVRSQVAPVAGVYTTRVGSLEDPLASTGHILRVAFGKDTSGGSQIDQSWTLRQNYVSEASLGTQIAVVSVTNVSATFSAYVYTLSGAEADAITAYSSLSVRMAANQV